MGDFPSRTRGAMLRVIRVAIVVQFRAVLMYDIPSYILSTYNKNVITGLSDRVIRVVIEHMMSTRITLK